MSVGAKIKRYRDAHGLSQTDLAEQVGCTQRQISDMERELTENRDLLVRIADYFNAPEILTTAVRNSVLMRRAMQMMGIEPSTAELGVLIDLAVDELAALVALVDVDQCQDSAQAQEHADRLADLSHLIQILVPLSGSD